MHDTEQDKQLVQSAKRDISQFSRLYEKYAQQVYRYCYNRVGQNKELAEDITSEVFMKAIEHFDSYVWEGKPFITWLYRIAHNLIVDHFKSKKNQNTSFDRLTISPADEADDILNDLTKSELTDQVKELMEEIPEGLKEVFTLKHVEDKTFKDIADVIGKSEAAVKMQYYRGLELLKSMLANNVTSLS